MIRIRFSLVFIFLWIGLTACEHKDLCYDHPHFATVRVIFDWTKISNHDKPEGMRVVFYPTDDESNTWIFDFPGGEDGEVELPENDYRVICFNYDTDGMVWKENGSYTLFTADTRDVQSPDNRTMAVTPPWLCGDHIDEVILKDIPGGSAEIVRLTPVNMVCHYTYEVNGLRGLDRVAELRKAGVEVILISSGAVASGRSEIKPSRKLDSVEQRQLFSAVGQAKLINRYYELFREHGIPVGQVLTTKESFGTRRHYLNQRNCMMVMLENGVIPIVNENDTISVTELMFTDNDELSGMIASMMDMQALIILSNIDGIYNGSPSTPGTQVIREVEQGKDLSDYIQTEKSGFGRGGMLTKTTIARKVADEGITVIIANGKKDHILVDLLQHPAETVCTRFIPAEGGVSSVKKWIAHSEGFAKGELHLNEQAVKVLKGQKAVSLLPVGVVRIEGEFEKDDIVKIIDHRGRQIGVGRIGFDSAEARALQGKHGQKPMVHYDYLYLD